MAKPRVLAVDCETIRKRLDEKSIPATNGCRLWVKAVQRGGYGVLNVRGKLIGAHILACELAHGPAPKGKTWALHTCHTSACIEGAHLYWGDAKDNTRDTKQAGRSTGGRAGATHCVHGHEFTEENTYWEPRGWGRSCKECSRIRTRERRARLKREAA